MGKLLQVCRAGLAGMFFPSIALALTLATVTAPAQVLAAGSAQNGSPTDLVPRQDEDAPPIPGNAGGHPKLASALQRLIVANEQSAASASQEAEEQGIKLVNGSVAVVVETAHGQAAELQAKVQELGGVVQRARGDRFRVSVSISALKSVAELDGVKFVHQPDRPLPSVISEGVTTVSAGGWHAAGFTGAGMKVAIVDVGFEGYQPLLGTELPGAVTAMSFRTDGDITAGGVNHGTRVAQIVHDMAPGAQLYLVNFGDSLDLDAAVDWLITQDVDVVNHSVSWFNMGPGDGTGPINDIVTNAKNNGLLWVNSSGNYARRHYGAAFNDTDADGAHNYTLTDEGNTIGGVVGDQVVVTLRWDDWPASDQDYNVYLVRSSDGLVIGGSENLQTGAQPPIEGFSAVLPTTGNYFIPIVRFNATTNVDFDLFTFSHDLEYQVPAGSIAMPADSANALAVGATYWDTDEPEDYSSQGPNEVGLIRPDIAAPDCTSDSFPGEFCGTSGSAPHVAGAAALVWGANPSFTPSQVQAYLESNALPLGTPGKDNQFGSGRLDLTEVPDLVLCNGVAATIVGTDASQIISGTPGNDVIHGLGGDDTIDGLGGNDTVCGGDGNDSLSGNAGNDTIDGGAGADRVSFGTASGSVTASLATGLASGEGADILLNLELLAGSPFGDTLTGNAGDNTLTGDAGNDFLTGGAGNDTLNGDAGNDTLNGNAGNDTLNGGVGTDTASFSTAPGSVTASLATGLASGEGSDTLSAIESLFGSPFNDTLTGNAGSNSLSGGSGNDTLNGGDGTDALNGGPGNDTLNGGAGSDTASFSTAPGAVTANLATGTATGDGSDTLSALENLRGSPFNDILTGNAGNNMLRGDAGNDTLNGGDGSDIAEFPSAPGPVTANLATGAATGDGSDTLSAIEELNGSPFNDTLTGNGGNNALRGGAGNDTINGGAGTDTVSFSSAPGAVTANLATGTATGEGTDTLSAIESLFGSPFNDNLTGNSGSNSLSGGSGNDTLNGADGTDALNGGPGNDTLDGGAGSDTASFSTAPGPVTANLATGSATGDGSDTLSALENLRGSPFNDILTGNASNNMLRGDAGNDTLNGGAGTDIVEFPGAPGPVTANLATGTATGDGSDTLSAIEELNGSPFNDTLTGNAGNNALRGGAGNDALNGGAGTDTVSYSSASGAVTANLSTGMATGHGSDTLSAIENLFGSPFNDTLTGNAGNNTLNGGAGNDTLNGAAGTDTCINGEILTSCEL